MSLWNRWFERKSKTMEGVTPLHTPTDTRQQAVDALLDRYNKIRGTKNTQLPAPFVDWLALNEFWPVLEDPSAGFQAGQAISHAYFVSRLSIFLSMNIAKFRDAPISGALPALALGVSMVVEAHASELHPFLCDLLILTEENRLRDREPRLTGSTSALRVALTEALIGLPPEEIPEFWSRLVDAKTSEEFCAVARQMRNRNATPFLLEALPKLPIDRQSDVIGALAHLEDSRAVPALRGIAADGESLLAPIAANAVKRILSHSKDDGAVLLRATDSRHAGNAGETLLRPASDATRTETQSDVLLRPGPPIDHK